MNNMARTPLILNHPRAWRTYTGGALISRLHGEPELDGHFPEEWIMSVIAARNPGRDVPDEGMAYIAGSDGITLKQCILDDPDGFLGHEHVMRWGKNPSVLVKLLDSAERLTIQVHPDRNTAQRLFGSPFGKTECWHILGGRTVDGQKPCVFLGFKEGVTEAYWRSCFERQDIQGMLDCLHRFEVKRGDTILIAGGVPHAIGAGCFLTEIQEPTDFTIRVERTTPAGLHVADEACHQGLGVDKMFECFKYDGMSREETWKRWSVPERIIRDDESAQISQLLGYDSTPYFSMRKIIVKQTAELDGGRFSALYVLNGSGMIKNACVETPICAPQQLFIPAGAGKCQLTAHGGHMEVLQFFGPEL